MQNNGQYQFYEVIFTCQKKKSVLQITCYKIKVNNNCVNM